MRHDNLEHILNDKMDHFYFHEMVPFCISYGIDRADCHYIFIQSYREFDKVHGSYNGHNDDIKKGRMVQLHNYMIEKVRHYIGFGRNDAV